jgi:methyltransferase-like protein
MRQNKWWSQSFLNNFFIVLQDLYQTFFCKYENKSTQHIQKDLFSKPILKINLRTFSKNITNNETKVQFLASVMIHSDAKRVLDVSSGLGDLSGS